MRLASIILATVRPDAAAEPKVEAICQDEVEKVSVVKAALSTPSEASAKAAAISRSSHSRATAAAATSEYCEVGSTEVFSLSKLSMSWLASRSVGNTQRRVKSTSCRPIGAKRPAAASS
jgi:hypothetical protein